MTRNYETRLGTFIFFFPLPANPTIKIIMLTTMSKGPNILLYKFITDILLFYSS